MPKSLSESFTSLLIYEGALPRTLDVKRVLNSRINKRYRASHLHMGLCHFCVMMMKHYSQQPMRTKIYYHSDNISDNKDKCIQFFEELCTEIIFHEENELNDIFSHLIELSKKLIVMHEVGGKRLTELLSLYESIIDFLLIYQHTPAWFTRYCPCETYHKSGECNCEIKDVLVKS